MLGFCSAPDWAVASTILLSTILLSPYHPAKMTKLKPYANRGQVALTQSENISHPPTLRRNYK